MSQALLENLTEEQTEMFENAITAAVAYAAASFDTRLTTCFQYGINKQYCRGKEQLDEIRKKLGETIMTESIFNLGLTNLKSGLKNLTFFMNQIIHSVNKQTNQENPNASNPESVDCNKVVSPPRSCTEFLGRHIFKEPIKLRHESKVTFGRADF